MTRQRAAILRVFAENPRHLCAEEVFRLSRAVYPALSRATVYNTLAALVKDGTLVPLQMPGEAVRYECNPTPHAHTVCPLCGAISDRPVDAEIFKRLSESLGTTVHSIDLRVQSICESCQAKQK